MFGRLKPMGTDNSAPKPEWWEADWPPPPDVRGLSDEQIATAADRYVPWAMNEYARRVMNPAPAPPAAPPAPEPPAGRCPQCSAIEAAAVLSIKSWAISLDGKSVIETVIGNRYACQRCPCIYSVSPTGVFRHHRQSSPLTPEVRAPVDDEPQTNGADIPPHVQRPIPKDRPRV